MNTKVTVFMEVSIERLTSSPGKIGKFLGRTSQYSYETMILSRDMWLPGIPTAPSGYQRRMGKPDKQSFSPKREKDCLSGFPMLD